jgi:hypothetical protein
MNCWQDLFLLPLNPMAALYFTCPVRATPNDHADHHMNPRCASASAQLCFRYAVCALLVARACWTCCLDELILAGANACSTVGAMCSQMQHYVSPGAHCCLRCGV